MGSLLKQFMFNLPKTKQLNAGRTLCDVVANQKGYPKVTLCKMTSAAIEAVKGREKKEATKSLKFLIGKRKPCC